ncbi:hypothetical protein HCN44_001683 [Aphidius gifuensis]|uniref:Uncharacterized protein n=1 Tax=Aphidius gifuensis TaxID=684658 RepID=A0A835CSK4_APHGI|nr:hypothetical protein HCN44_001683 [Aphidius gifuensis]
MFREKTLQIGERMLPAFETKTGKPHSLINLYNGHLVTKGGIDSNVFVAAEEFAEMLEKQGRVKGQGKQGSSLAFSDADGASAKQLDWEISKNQKIQDNSYSR